MPIVAGLLLLASSPAANAGMTVYGLNDLYRMRLQELSFFLLLFLICTLLFRGLWNVVAKDLSWMPRLSWKQAGGLSLLLGALMLLVLTMISGIREVLTPEAWRKQGTAYRLDSVEQEPVRKRRIEELRGALLTFADANGGRFPKHDFSGEVADHFWQAPDRNGSRYVYLAGRTKAEEGASAMLVVEPPNFGSERFVILTNGEVRKLGEKEIAIQLKQFEHRWKAHAHGS